IAAAGNAKMARQRRLRLSFIVFEVPDDKREHPVVNQVRVFEEEKLDREVGWLAEFDFVDCSRPHQTALRADENRVISLVVFRIYPAGLERGDVANLHLLMD